MLYTVTLTGRDTSLSFTRTHIADVLGMLMTLTKDRIRTIDLVTDVAQLGEYLECINGVWIRVTAGRMH